ncbi:glycosyltransferase [Psychroserpens sp. NJDZ02]|uniref:glycosyltransferase n=1 Tax=Psychroserpens sp. NJDZ02 TaxID=2570561 RepID=UPI0010A8BDB3|nr:glycosyltransferase [Psychroserpens sp. NJDZ02]QCE40119.1 glycosyltransferase [Psychroserpens sp. NJDZ02]
MESNNIISIIIPCYNDAKFIEQAIDSVNNQTYLYKEIIVVDDGSNKETKAVLKSLRSKIDILITQENAGQSNARNNGISQAKGDLILTLDSDDYFENTFCEKAINLIKTEKDAKIVTCFANIIFEMAGNNYVYKPQGGNVKKFLSSNNSFGSAMFKKSDWLKCGGYDESMTSGFEDWEFYINLLRKSGSAEVIPEVLFNYRRREGSTTSRANKVKYQLIRYIYNKHKDIVNINCEFIIDNLLLKLEKEDREKIKITKRLEYTIGAFILKPLRWIKSKFG